MNTLPTVFHITHVKSGSQWVHIILKECSLGRTFIEPRVAVAQFYEDALIPGAIYPTIYVPRPKFEAVLFPEVDLDPDKYQLSIKDDAKTQNWYNFQVNKSRVVKFVVIRDLRDTLVSLYFSLKVSHPLISKNVEEGRRKLNEMDMESGFLYLLGDRGKSIANIQKSWLSKTEENTLLLHYEDMLMDEQSAFAKIIKHCEIEISPTKLTEIVSRNSFEKMAGRHKGEEDVASHYRKGIAGDWKNHFTDKIKDEFKKLYGQVLITTGYEDNMDW